MKSRISRESSTTSIFSEDIAAYVLRCASGAPAAYHQTRPTPVRDGWRVLGTKVPPGFPKAAKTPAQQEGDRRPRPEVSPVTGAAKVRLRRPAQAPACRPVSVGPATVRAPRAAPRSAE